MPTEQLLLRLPDNLVRRFKQKVPSRQRSAFVQQLLEQALSQTDGEDDPLYQAALAVEQDTRLTAEMAEWEATVGGRRAGSFRAQAAPLNGTCAEQPSVFSVERSGGLASIQRGEAKSAGAVLR